MKKKQEKISLDKIPKQEGFKVPEAYFDKLSSRIQDKINQENNVAKFDYKGRGIILKRLAIAASLTGILIVSWILLKYLNQPQMKTHYSELEINEVIYSELFFYDAESIILTDDFDQELDAMSDNPEDIEISADDIVDYLMDENLDIEYILDEL